jgi:hypothetical protein
MYRLSDPWLRPVALYDLLDPPGSKGSQNWPTRQEPILGAAERRIAESSSSIEGYENSCETFGTFVGI